MTAAQTEKQAVLTEVRGNVLIVTLNRPEARNACNRALAEGICSAMDRLDEDPALAVGIITGGGGNFSAGADLKAVLSGEPRSTESRGGFGIMRVPPEKPLIAAIEGYAVGGGFELALSCDLIVAARNAVLGLPEVKRGLMALGGALFRLPKRIPYHIAMELILTGDRYEPEFLQRFGMVNRISEPGKALDVALELAQQIAVNAPLAVRTSKKIVRETAEWSDEKAWAEQREMARPALESQDAKEGPRAFAEKRVPVWIGR